MAKLDTKLQQSEKSIKPECGYCGSTEVRMHHSMPPGVEQDYICEDCFEGTDTGPCFDDLPEVE